MSKGKITAEIKFDVKTYASLALLVKQFSPDEVEEFNKYEADAQVEMLTIVASLVDDSSTLDGKVDLEDQSTYGGFDEASCPILRPGGIGLKEGTNLTAMFLGVDPMRSAKPKKNWKTREYDVNGDGKKVKFWCNQYYRFQDTKGNEFGIFDSPTLRILNKVLTARANSAAGIEKNPVVHLHYVGLVEGVERLKEEHGIEMTDGTSCHIFKVRVEKEATIERMEKGVRNYISSPIPNAKSEDIDEAELEDRNFAAQMGTTEAARLEGAAAPQIAQ